MGFESIKYEAGPVKKPELSEDEKQEMEDLKKETGRDITVDKFLEMKPEEATELMERIQAFKEKPVEEQAKKLSRLTELRMKEADSKGIGDIYREIYGR